MLFLIQTYIRKISLKEKIIKKYKPIDYEEFIINFLNQDQINLLKMTSYYNILININILIALKLIINKHHKYYVSIKVSEIVQKKIVNSFITYFDGIINAYGVIPINYFNYPYLDLILLIRKDLIVKNNYIYKGNIINYHLKRFKGYELYLLANNKYYEIVPSYHQFTIYYHQHFTMNIEMFNNLITKVYLDYYKKDKLCEFDIYLNYLDLFNEYETDIIKYYLNRISLEIPTWKYGGYSYIEINKK